MTNPLLSGVPASAGGCPAHAATAPVPLGGTGFDIEPQALYRSVRHSHGPVVPVELPGGLPAWLVVGYHELHQVASDGELFPRDAGLWNQWEHVPEDWPLLPMIGRPVPSIRFTAGAEHRRHSAMVVPALEAVDPFEIRGHCERLADRLVDSVCARGTADLVGEFAEPLPVMVLSRLVGFPDAEAAAIARALKDVADGGPGAQEAYGRFGDFMRRLVAVKRILPGDDITSRMLAHPEPFTDEEYALDLMAVTAAGHLTTADWISNSLRLMLTEDRFAQSLAGGRRGIGDAMNEVLWEESPTQILAGRWAVRDTRLGGRDIREGDMLLLGLGAANTDPLIRQDLGSGGAGHHAGNGSHLAFGHGEYRCPFPAQEIAETIARTGIEVLLDRLPDLEPAVPPQDLVRRPSVFVRGTDALPVRFSPAAAHSTGAPL